MNKLSQGLRYIKLDMWETYLLSQISYLIYFADTTIKVNIM